MPTEQLKPITYDEKLSAFDLSMTAPCDDRLMTKLVLDDYDWMTYTFETWLPTKEQGMLYVKVEYVGTTVSEMTVHQQSDLQSAVHKLTFDTEIFTEFLQNFMKKHLAQWDETYAFCGEQEAVELFNSILDKHIEYTIEN